MARSDVHPAHRFEPWQVWPGSFDNPPVDGRFPVPHETGLKITQSTAIASIGSCFAREIKRRLIQKNYNYITEETDHPAAVHASAAWERVYNTFCLRQIFEYTFEGWKPDLRWWIAPQSQKVQDPYRRIILYDSVEAGEKDFEQHCRHSRRALQRAEVLILTLGLTEIWQDREDGSVISLPSGPYVNEGGDMDRYEFKVSRYGDNLENLERIHAIMSQHNSACKLLVTISPVNLWATLRKDRDVISASCNSTPSTPSPSSRPSSSPSPSSTSPPIDLAVSRASRPRLKLSVIPCRGSKAGGMPTRSLGMLATKHA